MNKKKHKKKKNYLILPGSFSAPPRKFPILSKISIFLLNISIPYCLIFYAKKICFTLIGKKRLVDGLLGWKKGCENHQTVGWWIKRDGSINRFLIHQTTNLFLFLYCGIEITVSVYLSIVELRLRSLSIYLLWDWDYGLCLSIYFGIEITVSVYLIIMGLRLGSLSIYICWMCYKM